LFSVVSARRRFCGAAYRRMAFTYPSGLFRRRCDMLPLWSSAPASSAVKSSAENLFSLKEAEASTARTHVIMLLSAPGNMLPAVRVARKSTEHQSACALRSTRNISAINHVKPYGGIRSFLGRIIKVGRTDTRVPLQYQH